MSFWNWVYSFSLYIKEVFIPIWKPCQRKPFRRHTIFAIQNKGNFILFILLYFMRQKLILSFFFLQWSAKRSWYYRIYYSYFKNSKTFDFFSFWKNYFFFARWEERLEIRKTPRKTGLWASKNVLWYGSSEGTKVTIHELKQ